MTEENITQLPRQDGDIHMIEEESAAVATLERLQAAKERVRHQDEDQRHGSSGGLRGYALQISAEIHHQSTHTLDIVLATGDC